MSQDIQQHTMGQMWLASLFVGSVTPIHYLRMLAHNRRKWHRAEKRHAEGEDAPADENCVCVNKRSMLIKLKFLTTNTSQKNPGIYLFVHLYAAQCAGVFRFCYI